MDGRSQCVSDSTEIKLPARLSVVPPFPPVAARLLGLLGCESAEIKQIAKIVASDPMFTGRVLQAANSAEFGLLQPIRSIRLALTTLGLDRTRRITVAAAAGAYCRVALKTRELKRCWQHTVATAALADEISRRCNTGEEGAYSAGIMHDIGRLGLLVAYPADYENTMRVAAARCVDLLDYEQEVFGLNHAEAGRLLCRQWNLPEDFQVVAGRHHDPCEGTSLDLLRIVHVACSLADFFGYDVTQPLAPLEYEAIIAKLPESVQPRLADAAPFLKAAVRRSIRAFEGEEEIEDPKALWLKAREELLAEEEAEAGMEAEDEDPGAAQTGTDEVVNTNFLKRFVAWVAALVRGPRPASPS